MSRAQETNMDCAGLPQPHASSYTAAWLDELQALAYRFGCAVSADMGTMNLTQLWALYGFLKARAEVGE